MNAGRAKPVQLLTAPAPTGERARLPAPSPRTAVARGSPARGSPARGSPARGSPARGTVADALPRLSLRSPAELRAARGSRAAVRGPATLPLSSRVLLKRREVADVERQLRDQRQEFQQRMQRLAQCRQQLARRQEQHRDAVLRFDSFLKAEAARRERALRRAGEQRARAAAERAEAARLRRERERLLRHRERLARRLRSLRPFGDYLRDALASVGQESCWTHIQSTAIQKTLLLGQIKLAVLNLFQQTTAQLRIPMDKAQEDTKAQLDMVLLCMQALADICATGTHPQHHRSARLLRGQE